jgi:hypothetical protein
MGSIRHFAGKPPKFIRRACGSVVLRNRAECQSVSLVLTGIGGSRRDGDADCCFRWRPTLSSASILATGVAIIGIRLSPPPQLGCTPNSTASWDRRLLALKWCRSTAIIVPPGNRLRIDIFFAFCGFLGRFVVSLAIEMTWGGPAPITNQINEIRVSSCAAALASPSSTECTAARF